ncbi:potassium voltage-gated channel subfamily E member 4 [Rhinophrynus dorsalis]
MLRMEVVNGTMTNEAVNSYVDLQSQVSSGKDSNEYLYILIVMTFYGVFLMGIMLVYMRSKRREKESNLMLLYKDEESQWMEIRKTTYASSVPRSLQTSTMLSVLQENMVPALSCAACKMEGSSLSSESSSSDVPLTIQEEVTEGLLQDGADDDKNEDKSQIS